MGAPTPKIRESLKILGLPEDFPDSDFDKALARLKQAYHEMALKVHPDKGGSEAEFFRLTEAYEFLASQNMRDFGRAHKPEEAPASSSKQSSTTDFVIYKEANRIFSEAFEAYFKKPRSLNLDPDDSEYLALSARLQQARRLFGQILKEYPKSVWVHDAVEKIERINIWLGIRRNQ